VIFPAHIRTAKVLKQVEFNDRLKANVIRFESNWGECKMFTNFLVGMSSAIRKDIFYLHLKEM